MPQCTHYPRLCHPIEAIYSADLRYSGLPDDAFSLVSKDMITMQYAWVEVKEAKIKICIERVNLAELIRIFLG